MTKTGMTLPRKSGSCFREHSEAESAGRLVGSAKYGITMDVKSFVSSFVLF